MIPIKSTSYNMIEPLTIHEIEKNPIIDIYVQQKGITDYIIDPIVNLFSKLDGSAILWNPHFGSRITTNIDYIYTISSITVVIMSIFALVIYFLSPPLPNTKLNIIGRYYKIGGYAILFICWYLSNRKKFNNIKPEEQVLVTQNRKRSLLGLSHQIVPIPTSTSTFKQIVSPDNRLNEIKEEDERKAEIVIKN